MEASGNESESKSEEEEDGLMHTCMKHNDGGNDDGDVEGDDAIDLSNIMDMEIGDECPLPTMMHGRPMGKSSSSQRQS